MQGTVGVNFAVSETENKIILGAFGKPDLSNCYLPYRKIINEIVNKNIQVMSCENIVLLIQKTYGIHKMYYFVKEDGRQNISENTYRRLYAKMRGYPKLVTDYISRDSCYRTDIITNLGFHFYKEYNRYSVLTSELSFPVLSHLADFAGQRDLSEIYQLLYNTFDILTDNLPSKEELYKFIEARQVIKICIDGKIGGVLLFEKQGAKSYLRALCVNSQYKNIGIGHQLVVSYRELVKNGIKSFYLWVESTNTDAIRLYEKFGYKDDGLREYIYLYESRYRKGV